MKLAVSNIAWSRDCDPLAAETLSALGVQAIEVAPTRSFDSPLAVSSEAATQERQRWGALGLPIVSMQALLYGRPELRVFGDDDGRRALCAYLERIFELAGALGCGPLVFGSPRNRARGDLSLPEAMRRAVPLFRTLADAAAERGCVLCIEPNARAYECDFINTLDQASELVDAVDRPAFALHADTGNMELEGDDARALERVIRFVRHVHASEPQLKPLRADNPVLRDVVDLLREHRYAGYITLEMREVASPPLGAMSESIALLARAIQA